jgi:hypothetical protein
MMFERTVVSVIAVLIAGCAALPKQLVGGEPSTPTPVCKGVADCDAKWSAARSFLGSHTSYQIQNDSVDRLETFNPSEVTVGLRAKVNKTIQPDGSYAIVAKFWCNNLIQCKPNADTTLEDFNRTIGAAGSGGAPPPAVAANQAPAAIHTTPPANTGKAVTVVVPEKSSPESITVAPNGDLILGSAGGPKIYRARKGADKADVFVDVSADGAVFFLGVLSDAPSKTLWACELYPSPPGGARHSALRGFDLNTGAAKFRWELPGDTNVCNDFVVGPDKALYISDTAGAKIWRLKPGATTPELFSDDRTLMGIDGITFIGATLYENNVIFNKLYRVPIDASGKAGKPVDIWLDRPIKGPDGMRAANGKLFLAENDGGRIDMVTVSGDTASVTVLQEGLATPTAIEPAGDTLWYGERAADRAHSMPLPR